MGSLACDAAACLYRGAGGVRVSLVREPSAAVEDCGRAHVVVVLVSLPRIRCSEPKRFIGRFDLWREGAHALWFDDAGTVKVRTVMAERGARPWVPLRGR